MAQYAHTQPKLTCIQKNYKMRNDLNKDENIKYELMIKNILLTSN